MSHNTHPRHAKKALPHAIAAFVVALTAAATAHGQDLPKGYQVVQPPTPAPPVAYYDGDGEAQFLESHKGRLLVVNFWATWCVPCVAEMPSLDRLSARTEAEKLPITVIAVSVDRQGAPLVKKFHDANKIKHLPVAVDRKMALGKALKVRGLPTTIIIDAQSRQIGRLVGVAEWDSDAMVDFLKTLMPAEVQEAAEPSATSKGG